MELFDQLQLQVQVGGSEAFDQAFKVTSPDFKDGERLNKKHAFTECGGDNIFPTLVLSNVPSATQSFAIIVDDPDAPMGTWNHLVAWNIPFTSNTIDQELIYNNEKVVIGANSWDKDNHKYNGPCPPIGTGVHRYFFKVYALDRFIDLDKASNNKKLSDAISKYILEQSQIIGKYSMDQ